MRCCWTPGQHTPIPEDHMPNALANANPHTIAAYIRGARQGGGLTVTLWGQRYLLVPHLGRPGYAAIKAPH